MIEIQNHEHFLRMYKNYNSYQTTNYFFATFIYDITYNVEKIKFISREAFNFILTTLKFVNKIGIFLKIEEKQTCHEKIMCLFFGPN